MARVGERRHPAFVLERADYIVRSPKPDDAELYARYLKQNWDRFRGALPTADENALEAERYRSRFTQEASSSGGSRSVSKLILSREAKPVLIGDFTFSNIVYGPLRGCFLGFKIDRGFEGRGIMRQVLAASCEIMFSDFELHRISANYRPENFRSGNLLRHLGFQVEGFARDYLHLDGEWRDHLLTSLINSCKC